VSSALTYGISTCDTCGNYCRFTAGLVGDCPTCGALVHARKPRSLVRALALLIAAVILYVPANVLPIMHTATLAGGEDDTIMSGVVVLWTGGSWPLALLVFFASIVVPSLKLVAMALLLLTTHLRLRWRARERTELYRLIESIGRWSMLDVYVLALLVALVQLNAVATIEPGAGAAAFAAVVVLTVLSARAFDPRLIWDRADS